MTADPARHARLRAARAYCCGPGVARRLAAYWAIVGPAILLAYMAGHGGG